MKNLYNRKVIDAIDIFDDYYLNANALYLHWFNAVPDHSYIGQVDGEKGFEAMKEKFTNLIIQVYRYRWFDRKRNEYAFSVTLAVLKNGCIVEFNKEYCEIFHKDSQDEFLGLFTSMMTPIKVRQRREPLEINMIVRGNRKLELKAMEIKRTKLDLALFYADDFQEIDETIRKRLNRKKDKGIVLLHGLPGAGKTTYLRHLIGKIRKKVMFLSPSIAGDLMSPEFIELLVGNPNSVLIIEDAENIIMDRKINQGSAVSNLLNFSDGLIADFLNVQIICTFNNSLTLIDQALMRKGRLIAKYEFGKLSVDKSRRLSRHFGFDTVINKPMTIAEIANQHEKEQSPVQMETIGFRRAVTNETN